MSVAGRKRVLLLPRPSLCGPLVTVRADADMPYQVARLEGFVPEAWQSPIRE